MCRTEGSGHDNGRMTQIIVPKDTPGVRIVRGVEVWGHQSDHCEVVYDDVRVPLGNQLGQSGSGHQAAQDRLGAGRVYHCMNSIGQMWRAFDLMVERATMREVRGGKLETKQFIQGFIADSYIDIQAARLMTIHCTERMDSDTDPRTDISAIRSSYRLRMSEWWTARSRCGARRAFRAICHSSLCTRAPEHCGLRTDRTRSTES